MEPDPSLKRLPSVEKLASSAALGDWKRRVSHATRVKVARDVVEAARARLRAGNSVPPPDEGLALEVALRLEKLEKGRLRKVLNGTGVILHTNLGRAPLGKSLLLAMASTLDGYTNLELDLDTGNRGKRSGHIESLLRLLTGAESALVVNNNAAAMYLILHTLGAGRGAVVSRGELVQIGGGFRVPEILEASGTRLIEVGTTNITSLDDYRRAIDRQPDTVAMALKIHQSNFKLIGHVESVEAGALAALCREKGVPLVVDLGSGALARNLSDDPTVEETLGSGAELVCFSGDKCLGGPQAGVILGKSELVGRLKSSPLYRALRVGKLELFALETVLWGYLTGAANPTVSSALESETEVERRATALACDLRSHFPRARMMEGSSTLGGGSGAGTTIPTRLVDLGTDDGESLARRLALGDPPVILRRENKRLLVDMRTIPPEDQPLLLLSLMASANGEATCTS